jgi:hypothetical protein
VLGYWFRGHGCSTWDDILLLEIFERLSSIFVFLKTQMKNQIWIDVEVVGAKWYRVICHATVTQK